MTGTMTGMMMMTPAPPRKCLSASLSIRGAQLTPELPLKSFIIAFQEMPGSYDGGGSRSQRNSSSDDRSKFGTVRKPFSRYCGRK